MATILALLVSMLPPAVPALANGGQLPAQEEQGTYNVTQFISEATMGNAALAEALAAPDLEPLPAAVGGVLTVKGQAALDSVVTVYYHLEGGNKQVGRSASVTEVVYGDIGSFELDAYLGSEDGIYEVYVVAVKGGETSAPSETQRVELDTVTPLEPNFDSWSNPAYNQVLLEWKTSDSTIPNPDGSYSPDLTIDRYEIWRIDEGETVNKKIGETKELFYRDQDLQEMKIYTYEIYAIDRAGNKSATPSRIKTATTHQYGVEMAAVSTETEGFSGLWHPTISTDGSTAAFIGRRGTSIGLYTYNVSTGLVERIGDMKNITTTFDTDKPYALSGDGSIVAYAALESGSLTSDLYIYDRKNSKFTSVGNGSILPTWLSLSEDGEWLVFTSSSDQVVPGDTNGYSDAFLYQRSTGILKRISVNNVGEEGNGSSNQTVISGNGRYAAFFSWATNLQEGISDGNSHLYGYEVQTGEIKNVKFTIDNEEIYVSGAALSRDGQSIAASSNGETFLHNRESGATAAIFDPNLNNGGLGVPQISPDGKYAVVSYYNRSEDGLYNSLRGAVLINTVTNEVKHIGNRAHATRVPNISGDGTRAVYKIGLDAGSGVHVVCFDGPCTATPPPEDQINFVDWSHPNVVDGQIPMGSDLAIRAFGTAGQELQAVIGYRLLGDEAVRQATVGMGEISGQLGVYQAAFTLPAGTEWIRSIRAISASDPKITASAARLPLQVAGELLVEIDNTYLDALKGSWVMLSSEDNLYRTGFKWTENKDYVVSLPGPARYKVEMIDTAGRRLREHAEAAVTNVVRAGTTLSPVPLAGFKTVIRTAGDAEVRDAVLRIYDDDSNQLLETVKWVTGSYRMRTERYAGQVIRAEVELPSMYAQPEPQRITLRPGENELALTASKPTAGVVHGVVTNQNNRPMAGVTVLLMNKSAIESKTVTNEQGAYSLTGPAGDFLLVAEKKGPPNYVIPGGPIKIKMEKSTDAHLPLQVTSYGLGDIQMDMIFTPLDEAPRELNIEDWRQAVDYGVTATSKNPSFNAEPRRAFQNRIPIRGTPGDEVQVCSYNLLENYQLVCTNIVLDDMRNGFAHLKLEEKARIVGQVEGMNNYNRLQGALEKKEGESWKHSGTLKFEADGDFTIRLSEAGVYRINLADKNTDKRLIREVTAEEGKILEIPPLVFSDEPLLFYGQEGNGLHAKSEASAGEAVSFRGSYRIPVQLADANLILEVPFGATLQEESVMVNGTAASSVKQSEGRYLIPLGGQSAGQSGTIHYRLKMGNENLKQMEARLSISYRKGSDAPTEELVGAVYLTPVQLTLTAPQRSASQKIYASGRAPAGSRVTVTADGETIGTAEASPVGFWSAAVELPEKPDSSIWRTSIEYELRARVSLASGVLQSEPATVSIDSTHAVVDQFTIKQPDGRTVTTDPQKGVSRFPYVIVPNVPLILEANVTEASRVSNVRIHVGDQAVSAERLGSSTTFRAIVTPEVTSMQTGIYVTYDTAPSTARMPSTPTTEQWQSYSRTMPEGFRNTAYEQLSAEETRKVFGDSSGNGFFHSPAFKIKLPEGTFVYARISAKGVNLGEEGSSPYRSFEKQVNEQAGTVTFTSVVATRLFTNEMRAAYASFAGDSINTDHVMNVMSFVSPESKLTSALGYLNTAKGYVEDFLDFKDYENDLVSFTESVYGGECDGPSRAHYLQQAENLYEQASEMLVLKATFAGIGGVAGVVTAGWGALAIGTVLTVLGDSAKATWQQNLDYLKKDFEDNKAWRDQMAAAGAIERCRDDEDKPKDDKPKDKDKVADPVWIWDPSGYVYETVEGNRLEGVTATIEYHDPDTLAWSAWDADWYGQANPLATDRNGRYGWDVPEGKWRVQFEKEGYLPAVSRELTVLPPRFDVNVGMVSLQAPQVVDALATTGSGVQLAFCKYMLVSSVKQSGVVTLESSNGESISGTVEAVDAEQDGDGHEVARSFRFIASALQAGQTYRVKVLAQASSYASIPMESTYTDDLTALDSNAVPHDAADRPEVIAGQRQLLVQWGELDIAELDHMKVYWKRASDRDFDPSVTVDVDKGTGYALLTNLEPGIAYTVKVTTVNDAEVESLGVTAVGTVISEKALVADVTPPSEVGSPSAAAIGTDGYNITWTDPADPDLRSVIVSWRKLGDASYSEPVNVERGVGKAELRALQPQASYEVKLVTADTYFNLSAGKVIRVGAVGTGGVGGGNGNPTSDPTPAGNSDSKATVKLSLEALEWSGFEGDVRLSAPEGTFNADSKLVLSRNPEIGPLSGKYRPFGPLLAIAFEPASSGVSPAFRKRLQLSLRVHTPPAELIDLLKLGIYRKDEMSAQWVYAGGVWNAKEGMIETEIDRTGEYAVLSYANPFADVTSHWAKQEIDILASRHVLSGVSESRFAPERTITRAEMAKLLLAIVNQEENPGVTSESESSSGVFKDVDEDAWYASYVNQAAKLGIVAGSNGEFRPNDPVTRQEMAVMLGNSLRIKVDGSAAGARFADEEWISDWAEPYARTLKQLHLMEGVGDNRFDPKGKTTRAQAAVILLRSLDHLGRITKE
ncbi:S-layer homology domain-containing protein [Cohnella suwonensis]|uniref:S-layer homology domain-containing protein n=1 Tax=Cohnella suwonensis TaxID=696072 RepID=A0ABW0LYV2_9BACL